MEITALAWTNPATLRALELAALAVGRLDAAASAAPHGLAELLVLRCAAQANGARREGMIALLRPEGEGSRKLHRFYERLRETAPVEAAAMPTLVVAAAAARLAMRGQGADESAKAAAALAASRALRSGGAISGPWLSFPVEAGPPLSTPERETDDPSPDWFTTAFHSLEREARAVERGLGAARHRAAADEQRVRDAMGRAAYSALSVLELLRERLALSVPEVARALGLTPPTANAAIGRLEAMGIAREVTARQRSRRFVYTALVDALAP
jgi:DNA-binding transcriptional ArsR family regulator